MSGPQGLRRACHGSGSFRKGLCLPSIPWLLQVDSSLALLSAAATAQQDLRRQSIMPPTRLMRARVTKDAPDLSNVTVRCALSLRLPAVSCCAYGLGMCWRVTLHTVPGRHTSALSFKLPSSASGARVTSWTANSEMLFYKLKTKSFLTVVTTLMKHPTSYSRTSSTLVWWRTIASGSSWLRLKCLVCSGLINLLLYLLCIPSAYCPENSWSQSVNCCVLRRRSEYRMARYHTSPCTA